jgi:hypothetical protein
MMKAVAHIAHVMSMLWRRGTARGREPTTVVPQASVARAEPKAER